MATGDSHASGVGCEEYRVPAYFDRPFHYDGIAYIWDANNYMAADFDGEMPSKHNGLTFRPRGWGRIQKLPDANAEMDAWEAWSRARVAGASSAAECVERLNAAKAAKEGGEAMSDRNDASDQGSAAPWHERLVPGLRYTDSAGITWRTGPPDWDDSLGTLWALVLVRDGSNPPTREVRYWQYGGASHWDRHSEPRWASYQTERGTVVAWAPIGDSAEIVRGLLGVAARTAGVANADEKDSDL